MSDFHYGGTDEESAEIKKLNAEVVGANQPRLLHEFVHLLILSLYLA
jgi:hypothetical protein